MTNPWFLREDLKLELNQEKTLITHASTEAAKFLGYEITVQKSNTKVTRGRRSVNGSVRLRVPSTAAAFRAVSWAKVPGVADVILLRDG